MTKLEINNDLTAKVPVKDQENDVWKLRKVKEKCLKDESRIIFQNFLIHFVIETEYK